MDDDQLNVSNSIHLDDLSFFDEYYDEYYSKIGYYEYESLNQHMQIHSSRKKKKTFKILINDQVMLQEDFDKEFLEIFLKYFLEGLPKKSTSN
ncbi:hypothetical protein [Methanobrevibacter sp. V74]|uniref:hypothetical protein n=1 Tax=Methanobrevibacter sp. V74 TaxID=3064279 RepID=UPI002734FE76|nr:hypothetical protein [Methanobrevibacter sp. V74]